MCFSGQKLSCDGYGKADLLESHHTDCWPIIGPTSNDKRRNSKDMTILTFNELPEKLRQLRTLCSKKKIENLNADPPKTST